jgi:hypothetical protein
MPLVTFQEHDQLKAAAASDGRQGRRGSKKRVAGMPLGWLIFLASLVVAVAAVSPSVALAAAQGTARPLTGTGTGTITINLATGAATADGTGNISHLGAFSGHVDLMFTFTGASFTYTGTGTDVAANGDKLFFSVEASGTIGSTDTETDTITGGTGRFAGASGAFTETVVLAPISVTPTTVTNRITIALNGQISY